jgi:transketolase
MPFDARDRHWFGRNRFVLSNVHASMLLYSLLDLTGYRDIGGAEALPATRPSACRGFACGRYKNRS